LKGSWIISRGISKYGDIFILEMTANAGSVVGYQNEAGHL
jgi:hypothetical protein